MNRFLIVSLTKEAAAATFAVSFRKPPQLPAGVRLAQSALAVPHLYRKCYVSMRVIPMCIANCSFAYSAAP